MSSSAIHVAHHYNRNNLGEAILAGLREAGKDPDHLTVDDLAPVDQFHIRGREATLELAEKLRLDANTHVLDGGCGIGGASRTLAALYGCHVTGIDLTPAYIEVAEMLSAKVGLSDLLTYQTADALKMPFEDGKFDVVWTQHVVMNIEDKAGLYREMHRVLKSGGRLGLYDVMQGPGGGVIFPVPWAVDPYISFLKTPDETKQILEQAGFRVKGWHDTTEAGHIFFERMIQYSREKGTSPLGIHLLFGPNYKAMMENLRRNLEERRVVVIEGVLERA